MKNKKLGKRNLKRIATLSLSMMMLAGMVMPMSDSIYKKSIVTEAEVKYDGEFTNSGRTYRYKISGSEMTLVSVSGGSGNMSIPSSVSVNGKTYTVTALGDWFGSSQTFSSVNVPNTVKSMGNSVFNSANISDLTVSSKINSIGDWFGAHGKIDKVKCDAKNISKIGEYIFYHNTGAEKIVMGNWLVKYKPSGNVLDLSTSDLSTVNKIKNYCVILSSKVDTLKIGKNEFLAGEIIKRDELVNGDIRDIINIYVNGKKVECKSANDAVPDILKKNFGRLDMSMFALNYAKSKAKYVLESLGLKYYGDEAYKVKGKLSANEELRIALEVYEYIVKNYTYDAPNAKGTYLKVFDCHTVTKCQEDSQLYAFLLESAGVEAETVFSGIITPVTPQTQAKELKAHPEAKVWIDGKYLISYAGAHAWNAIKVGGKFYYVDSTEGRQYHTGKNKNDAHKTFMFSNKAIEVGAARFGLDAAHGYMGTHGYPNYSLYGDDKYEKALYAFQNRSTMLKTPDCNDILGDIDMSNYYPDEADKDKLMAFNLLSTDLQNKLLKMKPNKPIEGITLKELQSLTVTYTIGGVQKTVKLSDNRNCLTFDPAKLDVTLDGKVNVADLVMMSNLLSGID